MVHKVKSMGDVRKWDGATPWLIDVEPELDVESNVPEFTNTQVELIEQLQGAMNQRWVELQQTA